MGIEKDLNYETTREMNKVLAKTNRKLLLTILKNSPRDEIIAVCKKLKILKEDYNPATDKLEIMERKD